jgi:hypothetical protein
MTVICPCASEVDAALSVLRAGSSDELVVPPTASSAAALATLSIIRQMKNRGDISTECIKDPNTSSQKPLHR